MKYEDHSDYGVAVSKITAGIVATYFVVSLILALTSASIPIKIITRPSDVLIVFVACFLGAVLPDLDTSSKPSMVVSALGFIFCCVSIYMKEPYHALYFSACFMLIKSFPHRTITHMYVIPAFLIYVTFKNSVLMYGAFGFGLITHYAVDGMSVLSLNNWIRHKDLARFFKKIVKRK